MKPVPHLLQIPEYRPEMPYDHLIKMGSNENCYGPSSKVIEAIQRALQSSNRYANENGYNLRAAIGQKLRVPVPQIILGNGSTEIIELIARTYLHPGMNAVTASQTFLMYRIAALSTGASLREVPTNDFHYDLQAIRDSLDSSTRIVYIANPNNPTGLFIPESEMEPFLAKVPADVLVVLDEAYREYVEEEDFPDGLSYLNRYPNLMVLRTFSKVHSLAGLRIGYGIGYEQVLAEIHRVRAPYNTSNVAQAAALAALEDSEHVQKSVEGNRQERAYLETELDRLRIRFLPTVTNFILMIVPDAAVLATRLQEKGILVRWMQRFNVPDGLRVTIGTHEENVTFIETLHRIM